MVCNVIIIWWPTITQWNGWTCGCLSVHLIFLISMVIASCLPSCTLASLRGCTWIHSWKSHQIIFSVFCYGWSKYKSLTWNITPIEENLTCEWNYMNMYMYSNNQLTLQQSSDQVISWGLVVEGAMSILLILTFFYQCIEKRLTYLYMGRCGIVPVYTVLCLIREHYILWVKSKNFRM